MSVAKALAPSLGLQRRMRVHRYFATKEEAALCYSRLRVSTVGKETLEAEATAGERLMLLGLLNRGGDVDMTAEEALAAAEAEGLPLVRAATTTGYRAVSMHSISNKSRPFRLVIPGRDLPAVPQPCHQSSSSQLAKDDPSEETERKRDAWFVG